MVVFMVTLDEIKQSVNGSIDWVKIGEKVGDPALSVFPSSIKDELSTSDFVVGKNYFFDDDDGFKFKISSKLVGDVQKFIVFIKAPVVVSKVAQREPPKVVTTKNAADMKVAILFAAIVIVLALSIFLSGPILKVLFG
jgi:hypothetical protein